MDTKVACGIVQNLADKQGQPVLETLMQYVKDRDEGLVREKYGMVTTMACEKFLSIGSQFFEELA
jgi:hypothetical protein